MQLCGLVPRWEGRRVEPQDYSTRARYRPPARWYRRLNPIGVPLTSWGLAPRDAVTLEVRGRTSGKPRRIPILRTPFRGQDYLVSLSGEAQWVRNVRAASGHAVIIRRGARRVQLTEVPCSQRGPIIAEYLHRGGERGGEAAAAKQARYYFGLDAQPTADDIAAVAKYYPVLCITYES